MVNIETMKNMKVTLSDESHVLLLVYIPYRVLHSYLNWKVHATGVLQMSPIGIFQFTSKLVFI